MDMPGTIWSRKKSAERVARFLRLNYVPGTTDVPWEQQDPDERNAWLIEAAYIVDLVRQTDGS